MCKFGGWFRNATRNSFPVNYAHVSPDIVREVGVRSPLVEVATVDMWESAAGSDMTRTANVRRGMLMHSVGNAQPRADRLPRRSSVAVEIPGRQQFQVFCFQSFEAHTPERDTACGKAERS